MLEMEWPFIALAAPEPTFLPVFDFASCRHFARIIQQLIHALLAALIFAFPFSRVSFTFVAALPLTTCLRPLFKLFFLLARRRDVGGGGGGGGGTPGAGGGGVAAFRFPSSCRPPLRFSPQSSDEEPVWMSSLPPSSTALFTALLLGSACGAAVAPALLDTVVPSLLDELVPELDAWD